jgi:hypothetical protein
MRTQARQTSPPPPQTMQELSRKLQRMEEPLRGLQHVKRNLQTPMEQTSQQQTQPAFLTLTQQSSARDSGSR